MSPFRQFSTKDIGDSYSNGTQTSGRFVQKTDHKEEEEHAAYADSPK
jgi:hypothetical protein